MNEFHNAIDSAISEARSLRKLLKKKDTKQVQNIDEKSIIKATSLAWFHKHRVCLAQYLKDEILLDIDTTYNQILSSSQRATVRPSYISKLKYLIDELVKLQSQNVVKLASSQSPKFTSDKPPDFTPLIPDFAMQQILRRRWEECAICINAGAPLAATVMMGGFLEALLLARINRESNKDPIFKAIKLS